ncbi:hypothetical protein Bca4012_010294 [Brassica carinata]
MILYDCDAEALPKSIRPLYSYYFMLKWKCCPRSVQFHGFISVEVMVRYSAQNSEGIVQQLGKVLLELSSVQTSIKGGSVQISPVLSIQDVQVGFGQVLSDQPAAYRHRTQ